MSQILRLGVDGMITDNPALGYYVRSLKEEYPLLEPIVDYIF